MRVVEGLEWGKKELKSTIHPDFAHLYSPTLDAEVLLAHAMNVTKTQLITKLHEDIPKSAEDNYRTFIEERKGHKPLAHITGKQSFYGSSFNVTKDTLIPRPATEDVVTEVLHVYKQYKAEGYAPLMIDVGTGSGAIACSLAKETGDDVFATDLSKEALKVAEKNVHALELTDKVTLFQGNLIERVVDGPIQTHASRHTIIVANLPYLSTNQWMEAQPEVRDHEPKQALEAGYYGLDTYWLLFKQIQQHRKILGDTLIVVIEIDKAQEERIEDLIHEFFPRAKPRIKPDSSKGIRIVTTVL